VFLGASHFDGQPSDLAAEFLAAVTDHPHLPARVELLGEVHAATVRAPVTR
jgi:hypothetical protein